MTVEEIRELIKLVSETNVAELEVQRGENRVRIRRTLNEAPGYPAIIYHASTGPAVPAHMAAAPPLPSQGAEPKSLDPSQDPSLKLVKSPIVGTFYESASPGSPAFVRIGETVQAGRVLCIIESMKLMNEIEAEFAGVGESRLVPNGQPVEYGEALFAIRPI
jgi:acetyl-CoA carboxylase biotin carboxyl carrier protein